MPNKSDFPPFAPFPPPAFRKELVPDEWQACLDSWIFLAEMQLRSPNLAFVTTVQSGRSGLTEFLSTYFEGSTVIPADSPLFQNPKWAPLRRKCFLLTHRVLTLDSPPAALLQWTFLADLSKAFPRSQELQKLLLSVWERKSTAIEADLKRIEESLITNLDTGKLDTASPVIERLAPLLHLCPNAATFFVVGSDLLDSLDAAYSKSNITSRRLLTLLAYLGLVSLMSGTTPNFSLLSDHLYGLKTSKNSKSGQDSLLSDLVANTPLLKKIKTIMPKYDATRADNLEQALSGLQRSKTTQGKTSVRRRIDKGKGKATDEYGHSAYGNVHVHRMSLISQVQDLFPDLGAGFVMRLLDEYDENVEQVTAHLLDDSLPPHLGAADKTEQILDTAADVVDFAPHLEPRSTPPLERRNVFDGDELDQLTVDASRLHIGRKNEKLTADAVLSDRASAPNKAAILSALAAFDSDDDERDDTYDVEDVGGTIDTTSAGNGEADIDKNEEALFTAYRMSPDTFTRDAVTRRGKPRAALRSETGMTDEAIEGWAIMMARDPRKLRRLEAKYATFTGQQQALDRTAFRDSPADSGTEGDEGEGGGGSARRGYGGGGRGRGRGGGGGRGRGGNVAGSANEAGTQQARNRKEANKGSRANHNRRDQRAKKMARGGFPG